MPRSRFPSLRRRSFGTPLLILLAAGLLAAPLGCGSDRGAPVSSSNSQFQVADGNDAGSQAAGEAPQREVAPPSPRAEQPSAAPTRGGADPRPPAQGAAATPPAATAPANGAPTNANASPAQLAIQRAQRLSNQVGQMFESEPPPGTTPEQVFERAGQISQQALAAADAALEANPTEEERAQAQQVKLNMLLARVQLQQPDAGKDLHEFVKSFVETGKQDVATFSTARQIALIMAQLDLGDEAMEIFALLGEKFKDSDDPRLASEAADLTTQVEIAKSGFNQKINDVIEEKEGAADALVEAVRTMVTEKPGRVTFGMAGVAIEQLERFRRHDAAVALLAAVDQAQEGLESEELSRQVDESLEEVRKRLSLIGKELEIEGRTHEGEPFDWSQYAGKVVLVDFWATWCGPCREEMPNLKEVYEKHHEEGFEIVGVSLDQRLADINAYLASEKLPWVTVINPEPSGSPSHPLAQELGVTAIPFTVLLGRDGKVKTINVRGEDVEPAVAELLKADAKEDANPAPAAEEAKPEDKPAAEESDKANPTETPDAEDQSRAGDRGATFFVALLSDESEEEADSKPSGNPYLAPADLSPLELVEFIQEMREKPRSIQQRPGFAPAVSEAADRVLAAKVSDKQHIIAASAKFAALHERAVVGDKEAEALLEKSIEQLRDDMRPAIAEQVKFFQLERRALGCDDLTPEQIDALLSDVKEHFAKQEGGEREMRLASQTVRAINRLEDGDRREELFKEFGQQFAKSKHPALARYGKKLAAETAPSPSGGSSLVGQKLELQGATALGGEFQWDAYRGKVVLVDFWATWCGPCLRAMPKIEALHEKHREAGFEVVGVSLDKDAAALAKHLRESKAEWENLAGDETQKLAAKYQVRAIPTLMLVDREGTIVAVSHNVDSLTAQIEKLLAEKK